MNTVFSVANFVLRLIRCRDPVGPIVDGDVVVHDDVGVANIINDYSSSVFTNDKLPILEPVQFPMVLPMIDSLIYTSPKKMCVRL